MSDKEEQPAGCRLCCPLKHPADRSQGRLRKMAGSMSVPEILTMSLWALCEPENKEAIKNVIPCKVHIHKLQKWTQPILSVCLSLSSPSLSLLPSVCVCVLHVQISIFKEKKVINLKVGGHGRGWSWGHGKDLRLRGRKGMEKNTQSYFN